MIKPYRIIKIAALLFLINRIIVGQQDNPFNLWMNPATDDFDTIRQNAEQYFSGRDKGRGSGYVQWKRWEYLNQNRLTPEGKITNIEARNWQAVRDYDLAHPMDGITGPVSVPNGHWESLGIIYFTDGNGWNPGIGRVNVIAFHPTSQIIFWIGCPSGGLWKTGDGGLSWTPLTDGMPRIGVSGIAVHPANPDIMYVLTGDGDAGDTRCIGILRTTDGGGTWSSAGWLMSAEDMVRGYKLIMNPNNPDILFAVASIGLYRTVNAGSGENAVWSLKNSSWFFDIEFKPGDPTIVYACTSTQFFRSTDSGDTWTQITRGVPANCTRMAIGVTPDSPGDVYLFTGPPTDVGVFTGVYLSGNDGESFSVRATTPNLLGYSTLGLDNDHQTTYDLAIAVSRTDVTSLVVGGINVWKSTNSGTNWTCVSEWNGYGGSIGYTHADIHDLAINPLNNNLYCCSDGGVFRSTDFGENWTDLSEYLEITQWYRIAGTPSDLDLIIGGTQDNGSNKWTGESTMLHTLGADGMGCMINWMTPLYIYNSTQNGGLHYSINGGASYSSVKPTGSTGSWVTPYIMDPSDPLIIYGGWDDVFKSTNGGISWSNKGVDGRGAMAMGNNNTNRIYASFGNDIRTSDNGGDSWSLVSSGLPPSQNITFIAVNPDNSSDVFITLSDYVAGKKVYSSNDAGNSWTNISGTLPNIPMNCIAYQDCNGSPDDALYLGTDVGVFYRNNSTGDWIPFRNGLPTVPVFDLEIYSASDRIVAATYGRGLWKSSLFASCPAGWDLTPGNDPSNPHYTGFQYYEASSYIYSTRIITGGLGTDVTYKSAGKIKLLPGFHARKYNKFKATRGPCQAVTDETGIIPVTGTFTWPAER
jgi:photosystem II stability/assembly factor-like uncharacterized protein